MWHAIAVSSILVIAIILFITEWLRVDIVALAVVVALMLTGILTPGEALAGFSNSAVLTIAALFIVGGAVMKSGLADLLGQKVLNLAGNSEMRLTITLMITVAILSSVMSDTGTVAVLLPVVVLMARTARIAPSKLLIPLAFGSLLGGAMTLIGTPPNIIVSELLAEAGYEPFNFFSYTPMGLVLLIIGSMFMILIGRHLLPTHLDSKTVPLDRFNELVRDYHLTEELSRLRLRRISPLAKQSIAYSQLRSRFDVNILKILRPGGQPNGKALPLMPHADLIIESDDILVVKGEPEDIYRAAIHWQLGIQAPKPKDSKALLGREVGVAEVVLKPRSRFIGESLVSSQLGENFQVTVLNLNRPGVGILDDDISQLTLRMGDILLVQGTWENIASLKSFDDFIVLGEPEAMVNAAVRHRLVPAGLILTLMVLILVTGWLPVTTTTMTAALLMVLAGCLTMDDAYRAIDWKSVVLIAGMLPMSTALLKTGLVDEAAQLLVTNLGELGPVAVMAGLFLLTSFFTQLLSNTATTVIVAPIALGAATQMAVLPHAFLMTVAIAASMAFATPVASPVNTLVMGAGNYRFRDYAKVGVPLIFLVLIVTLLLVPLLFPLN